MTINLHEFIIQ